jgi:hypothetical protein
MPRKITWWPTKGIRGMVPKPMMVLMRYDWPDERLYEVGMCIPNNVVPWVNSEGQPMGTPDYFTPLAHVIEFINIPADREYTYRPDKKPAEGG